MRDGLDYRRSHMVQAIRDGGVTDEGVLQALAEVPRHLFVPEAFRLQSYEPDVSLNIGDGQTISQARIVAVMTAAARISADDQVLEIGTGSGYQAAVLSRLARFVFTVERIPALARTAKSTLDQLGFDNVSVKVMDGTLGWRAQGPYAAILVTAGAPDIPEPLLGQLAEGGRLVVPVGSRTSQALRVVQRRGDRFIENDLQHASFVPLVGRYGWGD